MPVPSLYVVPALKAGRASDGRVVITRKFVEGAAEYAKRWPGPVVVCMEPRSGDDSNLDNAEYDLRALPFGFQWLARDAAGIRRQLHPASVVLATLVHQHTHLAEICTSMGTPLVYISEYSLRTRLQIIRANVANPLVRLRREWWSRRLEARLERAVRAAAGVQCNGTPTYEAYRGLNPRALLYFDSRVRWERLVDREVLERRLAALRGGGPLRLAFSGRLVRMKGVDHLVEVAAALRHLGVDYRLDVCGGGPLEAPLREAIAAAGMADRVRLRGVLDFHGELLPLVGSEIDLFVCTHRQGDPSCTYLETMACGTPIVGYDNEALAGVVEHSGCGWTSPLDAPGALAQRIAALDCDREALVRAAVQARAFAARHTLERTMDRRVEHLRRCSEDPQQ